MEVRDPMRANGAEGRARARAAVYVFMPPLARLEDYLDLVAAVEATAEELRMKVVLEGYPPPRDPRLKLLQVTPDPGVIEVNIHPAHNWGELVEHTEFLYEAAFETRLSAPRSSCSTVATPAPAAATTSCWAAPRRRQPLPAPARPAGQPDHLLAQPPVPELPVQRHVHRPDQPGAARGRGRNDQLYELEIALAFMPIASASAPTAAVAGGPHAAQSPGRRHRQHAPQRVLHRQAVLARQLDRPPRPAGAARLRDAAARAHELAQQLLLRALVARFWKDALPRARSRAGAPSCTTASCCRTFIQMDFADVMAEMRQAGYAFDDAWFAPHFEFRFPLVGEVTSMGIELDAAQRLEPWHVMGEEGAGGTVRYVDSSLERMR
jgi:uncharacterized protein (DUF2126 family)